jgi:hypothetical protein
LIPPYVLVSGSKIQIFASSPSTSAKAGATGDEFDSQVFASEAAAAGGFDTRLLTQLGSHAGSCLHERLASENQEIRDGSEEEAEAGGRDREAGQGQEEEDLARQVI